MLDPAVLLPELEKTIKQNADAILGPLFMHTHAEAKADGSIVTEADTRMQKALTDALKRIAPDVRMLGEEMSEAQQQQVIAADHPYWCLDPVDGTNNFHHGVPLYSVSLALVDRREVILGIVYDPVRDELFSAVRGSGLRINGETRQRPKQTGQLKHCLASIDFKRLGEERRMRLASSMPFKSQRNIGSCALEWAWVAAGRIQLLLHGGEKIWDYAAGTLLLQEAGGRSCSAPGQAVFNHSLTPRPVIAASDGQLHQLWQDYLFPDR
jgi:myo-inositol-1(or 4)-monophosphatase